MALPHSSVTVGAKVSNYFKITSQLTALARWVCYCFIYDTLKVRNDKFAAPKMGSSRSHNIKQLKCTSETMTYTILRLLLFEAH
jgi:hypothetical protein